MKIFNVSADFKLTKKPKWLDDFRNKYDDPYEYHITLKQATFFEDNKQSDLEQYLLRISSGYSHITVRFNELSIGQTPNGFTIMIKAEKNANLIKLQHDIHITLSQFGEIIKNHYKVFENKFDPHITIARHLSKKTLEKAKKELSSDLKCEADINKLTLRICEASPDPDFVNAEYTKHFSL